LIVLHCHGRSPLGPVSGGIFAKLGGMIAIFVLVDMVQHGSDCDRWSVSSCWSNAPLKESHMDTTTLLIIIIVLLVLGGGWYGRGRWF
jgi:hypothetical protein